MVNSAASGRVLEHGAALEVISSGILRGRPHPGAWSLEVVKWAGRSAGPSKAVDSMPLALTLALRNLFHDRLRFVATVIGIVFSVVLVMVQLGLYLGFSRMVTTVADHADADLWIVSQGSNSFEDL